MCEKKRQRINQINSLIIIIKDRKKIYLCLRNQYLNVLFHEFLNHHNLIEINKKGQKQTEKNRKKEF